MMEKQVKGSNCCVVGCKRRKRKKGEGVEARGSASEGSEDEESPL